jgi:hypothetical protein
MHAFCGWFYLCADSFTNEAMDRMQVSKCRECTLSRSVRILNQFLTYFPCSVGWVGSVDYDIYTGSWCSVGFSKDAHYLFFLFLQVCNVHNFSLKRMVKSEGANNGSRKFWKCIYNANISEKVKFLREGFHTIFGSWKSNLHFMYLIRKQTALEWRWHGMTK